MSLLLFCLFNSFVVINGFNPSYTTALTHAHGATHEAITRCAVATVSTEYIQSRFKIAASLPTVTNGICPSSAFSQIQTLFAQIKNQGQSTYSKWGNTLDDIVEHNELVDLFEQTDESRHFDSESFIGASQIIRTRYQLAIDAINALDYDKANEYFGQMTHTLQDFYSHSNWIELNNRQPQPDLGVNSMTAAQFADKTVRTCTSCATGATAVCYSNNDVAKVLTSGYFSLVLDIIHKKPVGKCSHGGSLDATKNNDAIGGINKDSLESIHGYLHEPAAQTAYLATCKILRQLRTKIFDISFGKFLNILDRTTTFARALFRTGSLANFNLDPVLVYTSILNKIRQANSFSHIQQLISTSPNDSFYKAHILSIAKRKHITIDVFHQNLVDFDQDLVKSTGGLYVNYPNKSQVDIKSNVDEEYELIDLFYSKRTSDDISIPIDSTCNSLLLEILTNDSMSTLTIQLKNSNKLISPSSIGINTDYYRSYLFSNLTNGNWKLIFSSSFSSSFDLRVSCSSELRCFSRLYVDNDNPVHPGRVELQGNLIQNQNALLLTTCDDNDKNTIADMSITMIDELNGKIPGKTFQSIHDSNNNRWITNLTSIPSQSFRLRFSINKQQIQRLSRVLYQPSLIDVEVSQMDTTIKNQTIVKYRLFNYHQKSMKINFIAKNIGTYIQLKDYTLNAGETRDDQIEFDQNTKQTGMIGDMLALTVKSSQTSDWNYDVISL